MAEIHELFATAATADQIDAGVGVIWWATHPPGDYALTALDYDIFEMPAINAKWIDAFFERSAKLAAEHKPATPGCLLRIEHPGLKNVLKLADEAYRDTPASRAVDRYAFDIRPIKDSEAAKWPATLDERAFSIRPLVDSGKVVKVATGLRRFSWRAIRTNHLLSQVKQHRPGDAASAGELLHAFVLGTLLGTTPKGTSCFGRAPPKGSPSSGPFGAYLPGRRPR